MRITITTLLLLFSITAIADPQQVSNGANIAHYIQANWLPLGVIALAQLSVVIFVRVTTKPKKMG